MNNIQEGMRVVCNNEDARLILGVAKELQSTIAGTIVEIGSNKIYDQIYYCVRLDNSEYAKIYKPTKRWFFPRSFLGVIES